MISDKWRAFAEAISWLCGWTYFLAWSMSFYPQPALNYRRRTTAGALPDFPLLNVVGFSCYLTATAVFLLSPLVRAQYAARHPPSGEPTVRVNDLVFGINGWVFCVLVYSQYWPRLWGWERNVQGAVYKAKKVTIALVWVSAVWFAVVGIIVLADGKHGGSLNPRAWAWIDLIYSIEHIKLLLTLFKYLPQAIANYKRKSTFGWSIAQQVLDLTGSVFSLAQLFIDSSLQADWSGVTGNPIKFGLGIISLGFDVCFILQHYVLYGPVEEKTEASPEDVFGERDPLLGAPNGRAGG